VQTGEIKAYAVTSNARLAAARDIPAVDEAGVPGLHVAVWHAVWAPKGTPGAIVRKLNGAVVKTLANPATRKRLADNSQELFAQDQLTPESLAALHRAEIETWWPTSKHLVARLTSLFHKIAVSVQGHTKADIATSA